MSQTTTHHARSAAVQQWIAALHYVPLAGTVDYCDLVDRAAGEFFAGRGAEGRARASTLVIHSTMLARGEAVRKAGRPRKWKPRELVEY